VRLEGIHHITAITGDAQRSVDFYAGTLGLRLVKKTVNFDAPDVYHLYFGAESGAPGSILTFFEFPGATPGRAGAGMVHRILWRGGGPDALDFWAWRLGDRGVETWREPHGLVLRDPEGLEHELVVPAVADAPLTAEAGDIPPEHRLQGFEGARAFAADPGASGSLLREVLGFAGGAGGAWRVQGEERSNRWSYDPPPPAVPRQSAGSVHHIAWASRDPDHQAWRERLSAAGAPVTAVIDRTYFRSVYFREPSGVLFEIATLGPGFARDEDPAHLGEALRLPARHEHLRSRLERTLTPLLDPRGARTRS
jgi:glyoxalase family protein